MEGASEARAAGSAVRASSETAPAGSAGAAGMSGGMRFAVLTTMRNEGPHCLEWIAHHLAAGFDHFIVYTNDCDDGTDAIMDALAAEGIVSHHRLARRGKKPIQWQALAAAAAHPRLAEADWAMVLDCDEFVNLRAPLGGVADLIAALPEGTDALAMHWRLFGNDGHLDPPDGLTAEAFRRAAPEAISLPLAWFCKTLYRRAAFGRPGIHRPRDAQHATAWVDGSGRALPAAFARAEGRINMFGLAPGRDLVQLNHYSLRSASCFMAKRRRGLPNHMSRRPDLGYWVERNFNQVEDRSIDRMLEPTRKMLARLRALPGVAALEEESRARHASALEAQLNDAEEARLFLQLALAGGSRPPPQPFLAAHLARLQRQRQRKGQT